MSTRSYILKEQDDGSYVGIYCHNDGYLTHNGAILIDHYNSKEKVDELLKIGNLSVLGSRVNPDPKRPHSFDFRSRQPGVCVAYGRDRGEKNQEAKVESLDMISNDAWIAYSYVFTKDGKWKYFESGEYDKDKEMKDVKQDIDKMFEEYGIDRPKDTYGYYDEYSINIIKAEQERIKRNNKVKAQNNVN